MHVMTHVRRKQGKNQMRATMFNNNKIGDIRDQTEQKNTWTEINYSNK